MYFSSLFPYVVLACFLVRGLLLRGAVDGILHMFTPKVCGFHMGGAWGGEPWQIHRAWSASCAFTPKPNCVSGVLLASVGRHKKGAEALPSCFKERDTASI